MDVIAERFLAVDVLDTQKAEAEALRRSMAARFWAARLSCSTVLPQTN
jgi:hypothetical protein